MPTIHVHEQFPCGHKRDVVLHGFFLVPSGPSIEGPCPLHGKECRGKSFAELLVPPPPRPQTITPAP